MIITRLQLPSAKTWTPIVTLVGGAGNVVPQYSTVSGRYYIISGFLHFQINLTGDGGNEGAGSGQVNISLPVAVKSSNSSNCVIFCGSVSNGSDTYITGMGIPGGATTGALYYINGISGALITGVLQNNTQRSIFLYGNYPVD